MVGNSEAMAEVPLGPDLLPQIRSTQKLASPGMTGPLFLYHPESESLAVVVLMNSRLAANSQAISFCVLSPSAL